MTMKKAVLLVGKYIPVIVLSVKKIKKHGRDIFVENVIKYKIQNEIKNIDVLKIVYMTPNRKQKLKNRFGQKQIGIK